MGVQGQDDFCQGIEKDWSDRRWMGEVKMADSKLLDSIEAGRIDEAVATAIRRQPDFLLEDFDYERISYNAESYWEFTKAWIEAADSLDKPKIARWVVDMALGEFAYLEIQSEAAQMLADSIHEAKGFLASLIQDVSVLSDNPDAGLSKNQVRELNKAALLLSQVSIPGASY